MKKVILNHKQLKNGTLKIIHCNEKRTDLVIPSVVDGKNVTSIGEGAFSSCENLTNVIIPETVTSIGLEAFYNCTNLKSVTIPSSVTNIGSHAFGYYWDNNVCDFAKNDNLVINGYTNSIAERYAKQNGFEFKSIGTVSSWVYDEDDNGGIIITKYTGSEAEVVIPSEIEGKNVTTIGFWAFGSFDGLTKVIIPNGVTKICKSAFFGCSSLTNVTIPNSVTKIGDSAFNGCKNLTNITIPDSVTSIGDYAFDGCTNLTSITIPDSVTSIGDEVFTDCTNLTSVTIPKIFKQRRDLFIGCTSLEGAPATFFELILEE